jgi:hypothetical protein
LEFIFLYKQHTNLAKFVDSCHGIIFHMMLPLVPNFI